MPDQYFLLAFALALVPFVNGYCSYDSECSPGTCNRDSYRCECPDGYTRAWSGCIRVCSPACENGRICRDSYCECPSGYTGDYCQKKVAYYNFGCSPACENGGTCSSHLICDCTSGYYGSYCQHRNGGTSGYVFGGVIGGVVFISCIVGITLLRVCLKVAAVRRRTQNVEAAPENYVSAGIGRRVTVVQRRVQPTNPDAPPPYVPSTEIESSDPPPYTAEPTGCPVPTSVEDTPTPQPHPPEAPPSDPIEDPPEYLPPPGRDQDREPLLAEEQ